MDSKKLVLRIAQKASDKQAEDILILDMRKVSNFCDYFLIVSGNSTPHLKAISEEIEKDLAKENIKPLISFNKQIDSGWVVLDYIGVVVHIFYKPLREFYNLEHLWQDAKRLKFKVSKKKS